MPFVLPSAAAGPVLVTFSLPPEVVPVCVPWPSQSRGELNSNGNNSAMPALPPEARTLRGWPLVIKCVRGMVPSLALIFVVLGTIFMGLATPTEAAGVGSAGALGAYFALADMQQALPTVLAIAAASLLYVAVADLIPSLHRRPEPLETSTTCTSTAVRSTWRRN